MAAELRRGIVTPEAVVLEFETGGVGSRTIARAIDLGVQLAIIVFGLAAVGVVVSTLFTASYANAVGATLAALVGLVAFFGYPIFMETRFGATVGKLMFGLRVVTVEGGPIRVRHAAIRAFLQLVDVWLIPIGVVGILAMLLSPPEPAAGRPGRGHGGAPGAELAAALDSGRVPSSAGAAALRVDARCERGDHRSVRAHPHLPHAGPSAHARRPGFARLEAGRLGRPPHQPAGAVLAPPRGVSRVRGRTPTSGGTAAP